MINGLNKQAKVLTRKIKRLNERRGIEVVCYCCGDQIEVGEHFFIRYRGGNSKKKFKRHHKYC